MKSLLNTAETRLTSLHNTGDEEGGGSNHFRNYANGFDDMDMLLHANLVRRMGE